MDELGARLKSPGLNNVLVSTHPRSKYFCSPPRDRDQSRQSEPRSAKFIDLAWLPN